MTQAWKQIRGVVLVALAFTFFIAFAYWGGVPDENASTFWIGVAVLIFALLTLGFATWHLMFRPLSIGQPVKQRSLHASLLPLMALILTVGSFGVSVGAFWDEVWHRQFGIPFGEDLFWRPHLLLYFGIAVPIALALAGLYVIVYRGQGTLQQRFRATPMIGLLILAGAWLLFVLPADPTWHLIYGEDLTAWSIPHFLLWFSFNAVLLIALGLHLMTQTQRQWGGPGKLRAVDVLPLWIFSAMSLNWNQFFTTEWDMVQGQIMTRPEWLLPVLIAGGAVFIGVLSNHSLHVFGAATISGVLALTLRFALVQLFDVKDMMGVNGWVLALPSLILVDIWYAYRPGKWIGAGIVGAAGMGIALISVIDRFYPLYSNPNLAVTFALLVVFSLGFSGIAAIFGDYFASGFKRQEGVNQSRMSRWTFVVAAAMASFLVFFVISAPPPN